MPYYKHWTNVSRTGAVFVAHCTGCDWRKAANSRPEAIRLCKDHQYGEGEHQGEREKPGASVPPVFSPKVAKLVNLAIAAPEEAEAQAAFAKARQLYLRECAA
jgi:hypothetical protein